MNVPQSRFRSSGEIGPMKLAAGPRPEGGGVGGGTERCIRPIGVEISGRRRTNCSVV